MRKKILIHTNRITILPRTTKYQFELSGRIKPGDIGRSPDYVSRPYNRRTVLVQCFPLYTILLALGNPVVDYFSLDIEGAEYPVLKTIPFEKVCT